MGVTARGATQTTLGHYALPSYYVELCVNPGLAGLTLILGRSKHPQRRSCKPSSRVPFAKHSRAQLLSSHRAGAACRQGKRRACHEA